MSTVMKSHSGHQLPSPAKRPESDEQLRRDRWTLALVIAVMVALMALIIWLASLGGGTVPNGVDYWPMMP